VCLLLLLALSQTILGAAYRSHQKKSRGQSQRNPTVQRLAAQSHSYPPHLGQPRLGIYTFHRSPPTESAFLITSISAPLLAHARLEGIFCWLVM
jgi:hypothetical protein